MELEFAHSDEVLSPQPNMANGPWRGQVQEEERFQRHQLAYDNLPL